MFLLEPRRVLLPLTDCCNLRCKYCYQPKDQFIFMDKETAKKTIDMMFTNLNIIGERVLNIFGGEPTLNLEILDFIIEYYINYKCKYKHLLKFQLNTNLQLLNENVLKIFKKYYDNSKIDFIISIDGVKEINDKYRISFSKEISSFDKIMNNVKIMRKELPNVILSSCSVLTEEHTNDYELLKKSVKLLYDTFDFCTLTPLLPGTFNGKLNYENIVKLFKEMNGFKDDKLRSMFRNFIPEAGLEVIKRGNLQTCRAGDALIMVNTDGYIYPCDLYLNDKNCKSFALCNINDIENFPIEIPENHKWEQYQRLNEKYYMSYINFNTENKESCDKCQFSNSCSPCIAYNELHNNIYTMKCDLCKEIKKKYNTALEILKGE